jgi:3-oxoadipate enol-lactonase
MPYAKVRDIEVYYEIHGSGPPVLSISGSGQDLRTNPSLGNGLLEQHFTVLHYDQRGLGRTSKPDVAYTMADYADDAAGLLDAVGWARAHVVGMSFGGMVAQHLVIGHPARVDRLVIGCTSAGGVGGASYDLREHEKLDPEARRRRALEIMDSRCDFGVDPPRLAPGMEPLFAMFARAGELDAADPQRAMGARRQLDARADHDTSARLGEITAPTLVAAGRFDDQAPLRNSEYLAAHIPGARLYVADGGHLFMLQDPTAWPVMLAFLQSA